MGFRCHGVPNGVQRKHVWGLPIVLIRAVQLVSPIDRAGIRGSGGRVRLDCRADRDVVVQRALRRHRHFVSLVSVRQLIGDRLTGMASLVGLPIPSTPASVRRDHVGRALCALYAEGPPLIHLYHCLRPVPRVRRRLLGALGRARMLSALRIARSVPRSVNGAAVPLTGPNCRLP